MRHLHLSTGFTLIETLVAFVIVAISMTLLFRIHASSTTTSILAEEYVYATELARSLLAELAVTEPTAFARSGLHGGKYRWNAAGEAYADAPADADAPWRLRVIRVEVEWRSRDKTRRVSLETVKPFFFETHHE